jgi:hypothetical protein
MKPVHYKGNLEVDTWMGPDERSPLQATANLKQTIDRASHLPSRGSQSHLYRRRSGQQGLQSHEEVEQW